MTTCPKCGKDAWVVKVTRWGTDTKTIVEGRAKAVPYTYLRYRHYVGTRKSITLRALEEILKEREYRSYTYEEFMQEARKRAGEKTVDHYVREA